MILQLVSKNLTYPVSLFYFLLFAIASDSTQKLNSITWPFNEKGDQIWVNQVNQNYMKIQVNYINKK